MKVSYLLATKNNCKTIEKTLKSLSGNVLAMDLGSKDNTLDILKNHNVKYIISQTDKQKARNELTKLAETDWVFHIEPWEILIEPPKYEENGYVKIFNNTLITKETRFWNKNKSNFLFENPLYPQVPEHLSDDSGAILLSQGTSVPLDEGLEIVKKWETNEPKNKFIPYYKCFLYLENKQYKNFIRCAEEYLYLKNKYTIEVLNIKYYLANVYFYIEKNPKKAIEVIMECVVAQPEMAEYWCFVGDVFYSLNKYDKAKTFYQNAVWSGVKRQDDWNPIDAEKYKNYPNKRINECQEIIQRAIDNA